MILKKSRINPSAKISVKKPQAINGFSIVEMLVAVAIFSIVMLIAVGALLTMIDANRKAQALNSVMNNLNLAIESMSREIRVGTNYNCGGTGDCPLGNTRLSIISSEGKNITYQYNAQRIEVLKESGPPIAITAPEVKIDKFMFYTTGTSPSDSFQPRVVMTIQGTAGVSEKTKTTFNVQTMASQRVPDL
jgi:prepilin-type N-terminal cleavage/methylation domain-containing protein